MLHTSAPVPLCRQAADCHYIRGDADLHVVMSKYYEKVDTNKKTIVVPIVVVNSDVLDTYYSRRVTIQ